MLIMSRIIICSFLLFGSIFGETVISESPTLYNFLNNVDRPNQTIKLTSGIFNIPYTLHINSNSAGLRIYGEGNIQPY